MASEMMRAIALLFACALAADAHSREVLPNVFDCRIAQYLNQKEDGALDDWLRNPKTQSVRETAGAALLVDRHSGRALTKVASILIPQFEVTVLETGNHEQSFKATYRTTSGYLHFAFLSIKTYVPGPHKPFILIDGDSVYAGTCR